MILLMLVPPGSTVVILLDWGGTLLRCISEVSSKNRLRSLFRFLCL
jgi:hypothetical protein